MTMISKQALTGTVILLLSGLDDVQSFTAFRSVRKLPNIVAPSRSGDAATKLLFLGTSTTTSLSTLFFSSSKWDNLVDEDDDDEYKFTGPPDMRYNERNVMRQHHTFHAIREAGGKELTNDVYVREPSNQVFWFAGKLARVSDISVEDAVVRQWPLIEQHAANLRPMELYPHRGELEIWIAPGDSELDVAYNRPSVVFQKMNKEESGATIKSSMVGFSGEVYDQGEEGFRTWRTKDGLPANPEVNPGNEVRAPTNEEMEQLQEKLEGQDLNALYEEQQRREGKDVSS